MKKNKFAFRSATLSIFLSFIFGGIFIISNPQNTFAYDNDTHFWLTYYLAIKAGYTPIQATQIASANVSADYDPDTEPVLANFNHWRDFFQPISHFQNVVDTFHALPNKNAVITEAQRIIKCSKRNDVILAHWWDPTIEKNNTVQEAANKLVREKKGKFWKDTIQKKENPGVFLHYAQDVYSHKNFKSWLGHGGYYYVDFLSSNPSEAEKMAFNTLKYLIIFRKHWSGKDLDPKTLESDYIDDLNINDLVAAGDFSTENIKQIEETVSEFVKNNPIPCDETTIAGEYKYVESDLVKKWDKFSPKKKNDHYKLPPFTFIPTLWNNKNKQPAPNSYKARLIVKKVLDISDDENLPHIWRYDLKNNTIDYLEKKKTNHAFIYLDDKLLKEDLEKIKYFSKDEGANKEINKMCSSNQKYYLPFALEVNIGKLPSNIRPCE